MIVSANLDFELRQRIGADEGHNSEVRLAYDPQLDAEIVVKKIPKSSFDDVEQYFSEARQLYDARHPNVVDVKYACQTSDFVFLAMPYYSQGSVGHLLDQRRITNREIVRYGLDLLNGLHHVHTRSMVHFDVKPSNILIDHTGKAALSDFGLSRHLRSDGLAAVQKLYLLHWPPEYLLSPDLPPAADIYQAGLTLYRMCGGPLSLEQQAQGKNKEELVRLILSGKLPDRRLFQLHRPRQLIGVVKTALQVDPDERFPTVFDMLLKLAEVDKWLDWECTRDAKDDQWTWELSRDGQLRSIELRQDEDSWSVVGRKTNEETGSTRRQRAFCKGNLKWGDARRLVERALTELE